MVAKGKSKGKLRFEVKVKAEETLRLEVIGMAMAYVKLEVTDMSGRRLCESRLTAILGAVQERVEVKGRSEVKGVYLLWLEKLKGRGAWRKGTVGGNLPKLNVL